MEELGEGSGNAAKKTAALGDTARVAFGVAIGGIAVDALRAVGQGIKEAIAGSIALEGSWGRLQAVSGMTADQVGEVRGALDQLSDSAGNGTISSQAVALAYASIGSEARSTGAALDIMRSAIQLNVATGRELVGATRDLEDVTSAWALETVNAARVSDVLFNAQRATGRSTQEMSGFLTDNATLLKGLGVSLEEAAALYGVLSKAGVQGIIPIIAAYGDLKDENSEFRRELDRLHIKITDSNGKLRTLGDVLREVKEKGADTTEIIRIFGAKGAEAMQALIDKEPELKRAFDSIKNGAGELDLAVSNMAENNEQKVGRMKKGFDDWFLGMGAGFVDFEDQVNKNGQATGLYMKEMARASEEGFGTFIGFMDSAKSGYDLLAEQEELERAVAQMNREEKQRGADAMYEAEQAILAAARAAGEEAEATRLATEETARLAESSRLLGEDLRSQDGITREWNETLGEFRARLEVAGVWSEVLNERLDETTESMRMNRNGSFEIVDATSRLQEKLASASQYLNRHGEDVRGVSSAYVQMSERIGVAIASLTAAERALADAGQGGGAPPGPGPGPGGATPPGGQYLGPAGPGGGGIWRDGRFYTYWVPDGRQTTTDDVARVGRWTSGDVPFARGGITNGPVRALLGDNQSGREAVLPLDDPGSLAMLREALGGGGARVNIQTLIVRDGRDMDRQLAAWGVKRRMQ